MNKVLNDLNLSQEIDNSPISINKNLLNKENNNRFNWLTDHSRSFLSSGYIQEGVSAEERIMEIAERAENILNIKGFAKKFYDYMGQGFYSLSSPVWSNFGKKRGLPISCLLYTSDAADE